MRIALIVCLIAAPVLGDEKPMANSVVPVTYKKTPQTELTMHLHFPEGWKPSDKRPAIVFFFGGGWTNGTVKQFESQAAHFAQRGMVCARADYRVKSRHGVSPKDCVEDAKSAVRWLRSHADEYGIDPDRIVASGGSAGGHLAACTALSGKIEPAGEDASISSQANALVLYNPVLRFAEVGRLLDRIDGDEKLAREISPVLYLNKDTPPTIIFFGTADPLHEQGVEFVAKAKQVGARVSMDTTKDQRHGYFNRGPHREKTTEIADAFLQSIGYLSKASND